jgi:hypothetical protein
MVLAVRASLNDERPCRMFPAQMRYLPKKFARDVFGRENSHFARARE